MLRRELETSAFNKKELFDSNKQSSINSINPEHIQKKEEYSLSAVLFDPTNSSPQDKFINTIKQRIDKYYHLFD